MMPLLITQFKSYTHNMIYNTYILIRQCYVRDDIRVKLLIIDCLLMKEPICFVSVNKGK